MNESSDKVIYGDMGTEHDGNVDIGSAFYIKAQTEFPFKTLHYEKREYPSWKKPFRSLRWGFWAFWIRLRFVFTGNCGHGCTYHKQYGFVPEADCPVHDADRGMFRWRIGY